VAIIEKRCFLQKQRKEKKVMGLYCGIDLHGNNGYYGIVDAQGRRVYKKRLPNELAVVLETLAPFKEELEGLAVESTYNSES